ncbi:pyridoxamine 5'-phosphate oxidase family protein [Streptomyces sp. KMM 9044]|uniref:pyridoxamine 5'-phosphate oxidase family protein n=1 Tax=Streptomyces sp. KMM 9044 TaxID=2744474 RepID=UPI0021511CE6|nr:pyridoxamine 5'-phosphate oxidase family protein [Streptomyces sp. KMM 9044]WAX81484.1 DUF1918 domain-containing protein [Streptomyces sp. KMM 9044]
MRAHLGDHLVIESPATGVTRRDGEIIGLHHKDGTPPYDVRWSDTQAVALVFPGPDAHILHPGHEPATVQEPHTSREPSRGPGAAGTGAGSGAPPPAGAPHSSDLGRRVATERARQGLTRSETARRARMAPEYLAYLEEHQADPSLATLVNLASALNTTVHALRGGGTDMPPGRGMALAHPRLLDLGPEECRTLLSTHGVGRVAVSTVDGPAVVPVNYDVVDDAIVFRTSPGSVPAAAVGSDTAFEVDHMDEAMSQGWSVLAVGPARLVTDPGSIRRLDENAHTAPWAGDEREMWVSIRPTSLTGHRITPAGR